jgi:hypothetical protein
MLHIPYEKMDITWAESGSASSRSHDERFFFSLPWVSTEVDVTQEDKSWVKDATARLHTDPLNENVQKFIREFKDYPVSYIQPRKLKDFEGKDLQKCPDLDIDLSTPSSLVSTFGCPIDPSIREDIMPSWTWDREKILSKARIEGTDLYDPLSFITYLICYRLEWESMGWLGQDGFVGFLETLVKTRDEKDFFQAIGWISRQAWQVMTEFCPSMEPALTHFSKAKESVSSYIGQEKGHYKFMEQVFKDLDLDKNNFLVGGGTRWLLDAFKRVAVISPLAFSGMVALFEAAYYEEEESISAVIKLSSRPHAGRGYELHRKVNQEYRHCDVSPHLASYLAPQTRSHALLTVGLFELTLNFLEKMEQKLASSFGVH